MNNLNEILNKIPHSCNICLFPLRLETHFRYDEKKNKQLRVRIIPDEILLDYHKQCLNSEGKIALSSEEIADGKRFWIQWYIASGSERREYEAWLNLCEKYPVARAAWICRCLKPAKFNRYKKVDEIVDEKIDGGSVVEEGLGDLFDHRPFPNISEIEEACEVIYKKLGELPINEGGLIAGESVLHEQFQESAFEKDVKKSCQEILRKMYDIRKYLRQTTIVDYLYDSVMEMANHLSRRLHSISKLYDEYPNLINDNGFDNTKDLDYWALNDLKNVVDGFIRDYKIEYRVSLTDMVNLYLERMDKKNEKGINLYFGKCDVREKKNLEIPEAGFLPDKFVFIGEAANNEGKLVNFSSTEKDFVVYSKDVMREKIKLSIDSDFASSYSVDAKGLNVDESIKWMFDYDEAEKVGLAISVNVPNTVVKFNYIYVLGVKDPDVHQDCLLNLFNGHNYFGSSLEFLDPRISTNVIDDGVPECQEEVKKRFRYEVEVNGKYALPSKVKNDAKFFSDRLKIDYDDCVGHVYHFDSIRENKTRIAYEILWEKLFSSYKSKRPSDYKFIKQFFIEHVRATGNVPFIKMGQLPYGILPVTEYERLINLFVSSEPICKLLKDLLALRKQWEKLSKKKKNLPLFKGEDAEINYLKMAGQTPYSVSFVQRDEIQSALIEKNVPVLNDDDGKALELSILNPLFKEYVCGNQPIKGTDRLYHIECSELVKALIDKKDDEGTVVFDKDSAVKYVTEFIDLFTYRIDAWFNGVLDYVMTDFSPKFGVWGGVPKGLPELISNPMTQIGAYGWVFNLEEKSSKVQNDDKDHFVIAPSIQHALSAAVLRSAYLKSKASKTDSHVCVNLSSMRARQALKLVDGIRSGMSMSVVLGCDLERYMHDAELHGEKGNSAELDEYIYPLRKLFPQVVNVDAKDSRAEDHAMQVINGEALLETIINHEDWTWNKSVDDWLREHLLDEKMKWLNEFGMDMTDSSPNSKRNVFFRIVARLMDSYDALNDLLLSESVHRLVMGDKASFCAIGNFMANGEGGLPDPEILKTPSEYVVVSHKAGLMLPQNSSDLSKPFIFAEPGVDAWVESLIGGMDKICFFVKRFENEQNIVEPFSLKFLNVSASEYLYLSAYPATFINYLETRWRLKTGNYTGKIAIMESCSDATQSCSTNQISLEDDSFRIQTIRNLLKKSHAMLPSDWISDIQSDKIDETFIDMGDLAKRGVSLLDYAKNLLAIMTQWLYQTSVIDSISGELVFNGGFDDDKVIDGYKYLCDCIELGLTNCFTSFNSDAFASQYDIVLQFSERDHSVEIQKDLFRMVKSATYELRMRIDEFANLIGSSKDEIKTADSETIIEAIHNLTLKNIKIFPKFVLDSKKSDIKLSIDEGAMGNFIKNGLNNFGNVNADSFEQWQDEVAEVRDGMKELRNLAMAQTVLDKQSMGVSILQTTTKFEGNHNSQSPKIALMSDDWLGMPVDSESKLRDVDSLVLYNIDEYEPGRCNSGFIFDGWLDYIPYKKHNAGLVFHCDRPDAEAPQTVLLAVHPNHRFTGFDMWKFDYLKAILDGTSKMMKSRAVEPDDIYNDSELSRIFPLFGNRFGN